MSLSPLGQFLLNEADLNSGIKGSVVLEAAQKFFTNSQGNILWRIRKVEDYVVQLGLHLYPTWIG